MSTETTATRIAKALGDFLSRDPGTIESQHKLREDLGLDSVATVELLFEIEEAFDFQIPNEDLMGLVTVGDVVAYVEQKTGAEG